MSRVVCCFEVSVDGAPVVLEGFDIPTDMSYQEVTSLLGDVFEEFSRRVQNRRSVPRKVGQKKSAGVRGISNARAV